MSEFDAPTPRSIATDVGFAAAGVALVVALGEFATVPGRVTAALAGVSFVAFALVRYGVLDREVGVPIAGVTAAGYGALSLVVGVRTGIVLVGVLVGLLGGIGAVAAVVNWRAIPPARLRLIALSIAIATALGLGGILAISVWGGLLSWLLSVDPNETTPLAVAVSTIAGGLGTATAAAAFLAFGDRGVGFLDLRRPTKRDAAYVGLGVVALFALNLGINWVFRFAGVDIPLHVYIREARSNPDILLVLVPLSYLAVAPGEELLYRNVVQKLLYDAFSRPVAVVVASVIFALVHLGSYYEAGAPLATFNGLLTVFVLSLVLGAIYARTRTLLVPLLVHGTFNAVGFAVVYVQLVG